MEKTLDYYMKLQYKIELDQVINNRNQQKNFLLGHIEELYGCSTHADTIEELSEKLEIVKKLYFKNLLVKG
ncbi:hypothetical protein GCM10008018_70610 [Paenibacillus marchantiophytorum]|uniref:Aspartyl-phosphate phosphatase Spo0E family protein n=1 Tax=Paenibacillus marchantiophytorum TaxID=1619310 RepID=A0ABQ1FJ99_9BACL|nr:hypothetical protein [Paenibacillus marchantiophytorum]GGA15778.1 hypothetical protein GCM10008018_70610 [Paenibacillus marchantiophytorum]